MEFRRLGASGLKVPVLGFGTATFGGSNEFFRKMGDTDLAQATRLVDLCFDAGLTFFDTSDSYSEGSAEELLGQALGTRRQHAILATKITYRTGAGPNDIGCSRHHLIAACEASLRRLGTEYVDILELHGYDEFTPIEETIGTLDDLVRAGKARYVGCSNYSGWHLMKALAAADRRGEVRFVAHQAYYSLLGRDYEHELMPLALDQGVGGIAWSPLAGGRLSGKVRRGQPVPADSRVGKTGSVSGSSADERLFAIVDTLADIAAQRGKTISQVAINWVLCRPSIASVTIGARTEEQLIDNLGAVGWSLSEEELARLDSVSATPLPYPYSHQRLFPDLTRRIL